MYFCGWVILVALSVWVSIVAFIWAVQSGQFSDQGRARYLPLSGDLPAPPARKPSQLTIEVYALMVVGLLGLAGLVASIVLSLYRLKG